MHTFGKSESQIILASVSCIGLNFLISPPSLVTTCTYEVWNLVL